MFSIYLPQLQRLYRSWPILFCHSTVLLFIKREEMIMLLIILRSALVTDCRQIAPLLQYCQGTVQLPSVAALDILRTAPPKRGMMFECVSWNKDFIN